PTSDPGGRWLRVVRSRLRCYRRCLLRGGVLCGLRCLGNRGLLWCFLPGLLGWLWLLPRRAASAFWGTTIRGTGDQIEFRRSEEHTSELQSRFDLVCRLLLEKKMEIFPY